MSDYPDPEEEFELMYGDELELLREQEGNIHQLLQIKVKFIFIFFRSKCTTS